MTELSCSNQSSSDRSLLLRFRAGEDDAATELYLRYASRLISLAGAHTSRSLASRFDAEDVVQSVFRTFFRRASAGLYDVPPGDELWQLFLVIALNKVRTLSTHHCAQKRNAMRTNNALDVEANTTSIDERPAKILQMVIDETICSLPATQQQIVKLRIEGYDVQEIADKTLRSKRTVERILQRFRTELANELSEDTAQGENTVNRKSGS